MQVFSKRTLLDKFSYSFSKYWMYIFPRLEESQNVLPLVETSLNKAAWDCQQSQIL